MDHPQVRRGVLVDVRYVCAYVHTVCAYVHTRIRGYEAEITDRIELLIFANPRSYVTCQSVNPDWCAQC